MRPAIQLILLLMIESVAIRCNNNRDKVVRAVWTYVKTDDRNESREVFYSLQRFNRNGIKIYDSILFVPALGYKVNRYNQKGLLVSSVVKYDNDITERTINTYDNNLNMMKSVIYSEDTTCVFYKNKYTPGNKLAEIGLYEKGDTIPRLIHKRSYNGLLLDTLKIYMNNQFSMVLLKEVIYEYDSRDRPTLSLIRDLQHNVSDSIIIHYEEKTTSRYRKVRDEKYELILIEKILSNDSTELQIINPMRRDVTLRRRRVEYW